MAAGGEPAKDGAPQAPPRGEVRRTSAAVLLAAVDSAVSGFAALRNNLSHEAYVDPKRLRLVKALGMGAFGRTHKAELAPEPGEPDGAPAAAGGGRCWSLDRRQLLPSPPRDVAVKSLHKELLEDPEQVVQFVREVELLRKLRHRNIVELIGCSWQRSSLDDSVRCGCGGGGIKNVFFVQEFCGGGSLGDLLRRQMIRPYRPLYSDADALRWCLGIAHALAYLHSLPTPVMHRDLKLDNVMLSCADVARADAKLGDFGLARLTVEEERRKKESLDLSGPGTERFKRAGSGRTDGGRAPGGASSTPIALAALQPGAMAVGTPRRFAAAIEPTGRTGSFGYMAPEVLRCKHYSSSCDVFSIAMCMHNLFARVLPSFQILLNGGTDDLEQYASLVADGFRPPLPPGLPPPLARLITACWSGDPTLRPSAAAVVATLEEIQLLGVLGRNSAVGAIDAGGGCCAVM